LSKSRQRPPPQAVNGQRDRYDALCVEPRSGRWAYETTTSLCRPFASCVASIAMGPRNRAVLIELDLPAVGGMAWNAGSIVTSLCGTASSGQRPAASRPRGFTSPATARRERRPQTGVLVTEAAGAGSHRAGPGAAAWLDAGSQPGRDGLPYVVRASAQNGGAIPGPWPARGGGQPPAGPCAPLHELPPTSATHGDARGQEQSQATSCRGASPP
jgi:hypothetical protein